MATVVGMAREVFREEVGLELGHMGYWGLVSGGERAF